MVDWILVEKIGRRKSENIANESKKALSARLKLGVADEFIRPWTPIQCKG